jgi:hypothetical protein
MNLDLIKQVATDVRYWAEAQAEGSYMQGDLNGMCARASAELWRALVRFGFKPEIHLWVCPFDQETAHVFVVVDDHVVDITATQFSMMRNQLVFIAHKREAERWDWYQSQTVFNTPEELIRQQKKDKWPIDQVAAKS